MTEDTEVIDLVNSPFHSLEEESIIDEWNSFSDDEDQGIT